MILCSFTIMLGNNAFLRYAGNESPYMESSIKFDILSKQNLRNLIPYYAEWKPVRFIKDGRLPRSLEAARQTDLQVIRRTKLHKNESFVVRLHSHESWNEQIRRDLTISAIERLLHCHQVEWIEVDGDVDAIWPEHPSGKVKHLRDHDNLDSTQHIMESHAILVLDPSIVMTCEELERGTCIAHSFHASFYFIQRMLIPFIQHTQDSTFGFQHLIKLLDISLLSIQDQSLINNLTYNKLILDRTIVVTASYRIEHCLYIVDIYIRKRCPLFRNLEVTNHVSLICSR